jgi:opacity protein-like surface antigen
MKKFLLFSLFTTFISGNSWAKTQGNYVGVDLIATHTSFDTSKDRFSALGSNYKIKNGDQISVGGNYKYAFNHKGIFIAPGIFFDHNNVESQDNVDSIYRLNNRYGVKLDIGYDLTDKLGLFINVGIANNTYSLINKTNSAKNSDNDLNGLMGIGAKYSITENVDLNFAGELSQVKMKEPQRAGFPSQSKYDLDIAIARVGISYKF